MLTKLVGQHRSVEPVEGQVASIDHVHERIQQLGFLARLLPEAVLMTTLNETQRLHLFHLPNSHIRPCTGDASMRPDISCIHWPACALAESAASRSPISSASSWW